MIQFGAKKNKYRAVRVQAAGMSFASRLEYDTWCYLVMLEKGKKIRDLECQKNVRLFADPDINYKADFAFFDLEKQRMIYAEAKGLECERWRMIKKLWIHVGPSDLQVFMRARNGRDIILTEVLFPKSME